MKRLFLILLFVMINLFAFSQEKQNSSINDAGVYKLYPTENNWMFLKLNTRTGEIWHVQFTVENPQNRFQELITSMLAFGSEQKNGRFELYPTNNFYNFILLDTIDGRAWQVQWGKEHQILPIR
ncbi:MAG: hypothetical protein MJ211_14180 [Bacteroidales bacterium]|nr:hypothetical protein [Bacteroidales bacterium]